ERQESRADILRVRGVIAFLEVALKNVGPELDLRRRQTLQLEAAPGAEVVVRDELVRQGRLLLLLRPWPRLVANDFVLLFDVLLLEHHVEDERLEFVREGLRLRGR